MTAVDLCNIIKACSGAGVRLLKFSDFEVFFDDPITVNQQRSLLSEQSTTAQVEAQTQTDQDVIVNEELEIKRQRLENMGITDPDELEELLESDSLTNG